MATFTQVLSLLLKYPEHRRGRLFEKLCAWFLQNEPAYRRQIRRVWLWNQWSERWGAEAGIDLVAETLGNELWAVQAKTYHSDYYVTKADIDSFLSELNRPAFSFRLLIATTNHLGVNAQRVLDAQEKPVRVLDLFRLEQASVNWPASLRSFTARRLAGKRPRPHQRRAIRAVVQGFRRARWGQLIMACGMGKTLVGLWIAERLRARRTLVLVPSLSLLSQTIREWTANGTQTFSLLPVCSDETVGDSDQVVARVSELGLPATTDPRKIAAFLRGPGTRIVFATYQSSPEVARAFTRRSILPFDLTIADEAHRCAGPVSSNFGVILDDRSVPARRKLFMTATPRYFTQRVIRAAGEVDWDIASMDDAMRFGPVFHSLSFSEAIDQKLLTDYQVSIVGVDNETFRRYVARRQLVTTDGRRIRDARSLATEIILAKSMRRFDLRRVISFHNRVVRARAFSRRFPQIVAWMPSSQRPRGPLWAKHVSGDMPTGTRDALLWHFRHLDESERGLLTNARCLGEGVDVPTLDGVAFIDPRRSQVDIVQAVGRAIRRSETKRLGTIVLPVFINRGDSPEQVPEESQFRSIWDVLRALRSHDDDLAEQLDTLRRQLGDRGTVKGWPGKIHVDLPRRVGKSFIRAFEVRLVEATTASWEFWYGRLLRFVRRHSHARVPSEYREEGFRLGRWVIKQRARRRRLAPERVQQLEALPGWEWDARLASWEDGFATLQRFAKHNGHARVSATHREGGFRLGLWAVVQRVFYRKGTLDRDRVRRLEALPGWVWNPRVGTWESAFEVLQRFVSRYGHARIGVEQSVDGFALGKWVHKQRTAFRQGRLDRGRRGRLEKLPGWEWDPKGMAWTRAFARMERFVHREGHARVPATLRQDGFHLGAWAYVQRRRYRRGVLSRDRARRLKSLPGWEWSHAEALDGSER